MSKEKVKYESFAQEVWQRLSEINVNEMTEVKGKLTYLSWASAWAALMEMFPESSYQRGEDEYFQDGTMSVSMSITIQRGSDSLKRDMYLQVLDYKMKPVEMPSSHLINNTRMRCLTKAIAMCGLGHYIYQGHDLPTDEAVQVVAKTPRVPHEEHLETNKQAMDEAPSLERLKLLSRSAYDYFKKWGEDELALEVKKHFEMLEQNFTNQAE